jgi:hypothetical protein
VAFSSSTAAGTPFRLKEYTHPAKTTVGTRKIDPDTIGFMLMAQ